MNRLGSRRQLATNLTADRENSGSPLWALLFPLLVFVATYIAFAPAIRGDFLQWDDDVLLLNNPDYRGFGADQIRWMFSTTMLGNFMPFTWLSYAVDYALVGMRPVGYHITNNLLHAFDAALVFGLARLLIRIAQPTARPPSLIAGAFVAAMLFGIHPLRVESVAWITERKDVLSAFFLISSVYTYVRFARTAGATWYAASLLLLALSLLSKAWGLTLPAVLLVLDWCPLARWTRDKSRKLILEKLPFAAVSGAMACITLWAQTREVASLSGANIPDRIAQSLYGLVFYVGKTLIPIGLSPIYEHPIPMNPFAAPFVAATAGVLVLAAGLWFVRRTGAGKAALAAFAVYAIVLLPVLGLVQVGPQLVADRYSYVACIPLAILAGGAITRAAERLTRRTFAILSGVVIAGLTLLAAMTWRQCGYWRNSWVLWQRALEVDPQSWTAHNGIGALYMQFDDFERATQHLRQAADRRPDHPGIAINLAGAYAKTRRTDQSAAMFRKAASMPGLTSADLLLIGNGLEVLGLRDEARDAYSRAIEQNADEAEAHYRLATLLFASGDRKSAKQHFIKAVELLEPSVRRGQHDGGIFVDAAIFGSACDALARQLDAEGDARTANEYREKRKLLQAR